MRKINDKKSPDNLLTLWWLEQSRADPLHVFFHTRTTQFQLQISNKTNPVKPLSHHVLHVFPLNSHTWQISMFDAQTIAQHLKTPMFSGFHPPFSMVNHGETMIFPGETTMFPAKTHGFSSLQGVLLRCRCQSVGAGGPDAVPARHQRGEDRRRRPANLHGSAGRSLPRLPMLMKKMRGDQAGCQHVVDLYWFIDDL